jgi:hypothetical protein
MSLRPGKEGRSSQTGEHHDHHYGRRQTQARSFTQPNFDQPLSTSERSLPVAE